MANINDWLTAEEAGKYLGCSSSSVGVWAVEGKIPFSAKGNMRLFHVKDLDLFKADRARELEAKKNKYKYGHHARLSLEVLDACHREFTRVVNELIEYQGLSEVTKACLIETRVNIKNVLIQFKMLDTGVPHT